MVEFALVDSSNWCYTLIKLSIGLLEFLSSFSVRSISYRCSFRGAFAPRTIPFFVSWRKNWMEHKYNKTTENYLDLLATRLAEVRLSELGLNFIPNISPVFRHIKQFVETKAFIVKQAEGGNL